MNCCWASTSELESNFSSLRLLKQGLKSNTSAENLKHLMKCLLDAPDPHQHAPESNGCYTTTSLVLQVQEIWRKAFGAVKVSVKEKTDRALPRRETGARNKKRRSGMAAFLARREREIKACGKLQASMDHLESLADATASAGKKRKEYQSFSQRMEEKAKKRRTLLQALVDGTDKHAASELAKDKEQAKKSLFSKDFGSIIRKDLKRNKLEGNIFLQPELCLVVAVIDPISKSQGQLLEKLGFPTMTFSTAPEDMSQIVKASSLIWLATTKSAETGLIDPSGPDVPDCVLVSRLLGGFVAGPEWLAFLGHGQSDLVLTQPVLQLQSGFGFKQQLCFSTKMPQHELIKFVHAEAGKDPARSMYMRWSLQTSRSKLLDSQTLVTFCLQCLLDQQLVLSKCVPNQCHLRSQKTAWAVMSAEKFKKTAKHDSKLTGEEKKAQGRLGLAMDLSTFVGRITWSAPRCLL